MNVHEMIHGSLACNCALYVPYGMFAEHHRSAIRQGYHCFDHILSLFGRVSHHQAADLVALPSDPHCPVAVHQHLTASIRRIVDDFTGPTPRTAQLVYGFISTKINNLSFVQLLFNVLTFHRAQGTQGPR